MLEIDGASNTGVDDIRELRENIRYLPSRSRYKIFIIDEVHMLSINAFNALLKTLEEPPDHAKFILPRRNHIKFRLRSCPAASVLILKKSLCLLYRKDCVLSLIRKGSKFQTMVWLLLPAVVAGACATRVTLDQSCFCGDRSMTRKCRTCLDWSVDDCWWQPWRRF